MLPCQCLLGLLSTARANSATNTGRSLVCTGRHTQQVEGLPADSPADAVPSTTGCVLATLTSQMPSLWPMYSFTSWHTALDVVVLKLETI